MSRKPSVNVEGDRIECLQCTCLRPKSQIRNTDIWECHYHKERLKNWEKWITKRKRIQDRLTKSLDRSAGDLIMNLGEEYRRIQEERDVFDYCNINTNFDKYRGNPAFWKLPVGLSDRSNRFLDPTYFAYKTKVEENEIPVLEHVAIPNFVKNEKNIFPCNRNLQVIRHKDKCTTIRKLSSKINQIEPHWPECEELIVVGQKVRPKKESSYLSHSQKAAIPLDTKQIVAKPNSTEVSTTSKTCFLVNGKMICQYNEFSHTIMKIRLIFECTTKMKTPEVKYITFENRGLTTVRFYWHRIKKFLLFRDLIKNDEESHSFYFNKNELVLPPEETLHFPIWFKSNHIGNYFEMWEITTKPRMWNGDFKLVVNLQGFVYPADFDKRSSSMKERLLERVAHTSVQGVLNDIIHNLKFQDRDSDIYSFTEEQIFESVNQEMWGIEKRPKYLYEKNSVAQLKLLYNSIKFPYLTTYWDYSIRDLKTTARKKDIYVYVENQTKAMMKGKQRRIELNTNQDDSGEPIPKAEEAVVEDAQDTYSWRLDMILQGLDRPSMIKNTERLKYFIAYSVIRTYLFKMVDALEKCNNPTSVSDDCLPSYNYESVKDIEQAPERLLFERFDDIWMDKPKGSQPESKLDLMALPKSELLKGIPTENSKLIFRTYFNVEEEVEKTKGTNKKNHKGHKTNGEKSVKSKDVGAVFQTSNPHYSTIKNDFDPFEHVYLPKKTSSFSRSYRVRTVALGASKADIDYNRCLIVHSILNEAIEVMVDALETLKENILDIEILGKLIECTDEKTKTQQFLPEDEYIAVKQKQEADGSSSPLATLEHDSYFINLLDCHLNKNLHTKEYIVVGRRKHSRDDNIQPNYQETLDSDSIGSWLFKSGETIEEPVKLTASAQVQTSALTDDAEELSELSSESVLITVTNCNTSTTSEDLAQNAFYYVKEEEKSQDIK